MTNENKNPIRFDNLRATVAQYEAEQNAKTAAELAEKTCSDLLGSWYWLDRMTEKAFEALKASEPNAKPAPEIVEKITKKAARMEAKHTAERLYKIEQAEAAADIDGAQITVEYTRSRTWGYIPHATICGFNEVTKGSASGCGYDKQSAAIASAMNYNPEIMRILYKHAEAGLPFAYSVHVFAGLPSFDGGCGVSCFREVFDGCGYEWYDTASGNLFDAYSMTRKA